MDPTTWDAPFPLVFAALFGIVLLRAGGTYALGRAVAAGTAHSRLRHLLQSRGYTTAQRLLDRFGAPAVTLSFFTVGLQTAVNVAAGVVRMPLRHYLPALALGGVIWALIYSTVGFIGVATMQLLWGRSPALAVAVAALLVGGLVWWLVGRRVASVAPAPYQARAETESGQSRIASAVD